MIRKRDEGAPSTKPGHRQAAARAQPPATEAPPRRKSSEVPTLPPPSPHHSGMRAKKRTTIPAPSATVDEVVADLRDDPRCERDDDDD
jgi:hypothetical protein